MRVGYEAKRAFLNRTGLGNYCRGVITMMAENYPVNQYFLYTPKTEKQVEAKFIGTYPSIQVITPVSPRCTSLWRSKGVIADLKRDGIELYHGLSHELPFGIEKSGIKSIVTVHDLIFKRFPQYFGFFSRQIYSVKLKYACKHADAVIAVSETTKADLIELIKTDPAKIVVAYQGCDKIFWNAQSDEKKHEVKKKYNLPERFLLNVGTIEERKNLMVLIKALRLLPISTKLVVVGRQTAYAKQITKYISRHQLSSRVTFIHDAAFTDFPSIYQLADLFIYPSRYEGFGIPVLEALVSGTPVIAATGSCIEEAGGPDSVYVNPDDEVELAEKINLLLTHTDRRAGMSENGRKFAQRFDEKKLAGQLMNIYDNTVNHA